jgi:ribonucleoside-diphosphate reductase alpha chain
MLGVLDESGYPISEMGVLEVPDEPEGGKSHGYHVRTGKACGECGNLAVIHKDGCDFCTACGAVGSCG